MSQILYHWLLLLNPFRLCETYYLHFTTRVFDHNAISPFLGGSQGSGLLPGFSPQTNLKAYLFFCFFVCLFVEIKPEKLYSCVGREVNPLGVIIHGPQRHKVSIDQILSRCSSRVLWHEKFQYKEQRRRVAFPTKERPLWYTTKSIMFWLVVFFTTSTFCNFRDPCAIL